MKTPHRPRTLSAAFVLAAALALSVACAVVAALAPRDVRAQSVTGVVRDSVTADPLPGVLVSVVGPDGARVRAELSDEDGRFDIAVPLGRYRLSADRIGLRPTTTEPFDVDVLRPVDVPLTMSGRAVEIPGLVVDSRVQSCRLDPEGAVRIQRWWREIRTALDVSAALQEEEFAEFRVERFVREWRADVRRIVASSQRREVSTSSRPFVSESASFLADGGYVQGEAAGQRQYYAPDAEALLSDVFLGGHCFSVVTDGDRDEQLGLRFEPTAERRVTEIVGTLWVDTTTAELQDMEFRYAGLPEVDADRAGGRVGFDYLPSGAWIVSDWYIRMPKLAVREGGGRGYEVIGYVDVGADVELFRDDRPADVPGVVGAIRGVVYDSIRGAGLPDARVTILGTRFEATTDPAGQFILTNVPVGSQEVTFFHDDLEAWGLGSSFTEVVVEQNLTSDVELAVPAFRSAAMALCGAEVTQAQTVVVGRLLGPERHPMSRHPIGFVWQVDAGADGASSRDLSAITGSDGRFMVCTIPGEVRVTLRVEVDGRIVDAADFVPPTHEVTYREVWFTR